MLGGIKMALKTPEEYEESLRKMNFKIYLMSWSKTLWITPSFDLQ